MISLKVILYLANFNFNMAVREVISIFYVLYLKFIRITPKIKSIDHRSFPTA